MLTATLLTDGLFKFGAALIERIFPDPEQRAKAEIELLKLQQAGQLAELAAEVELAKAQTDINIEEAKHASIFVSGWRPFIGWVCGGALAFQFVGRPIITGFGVEFGSLDITDLITVLLGMLGLGGLRTYEKLKGVTRS
jgi:hypothetical protein